MQVYLFKGSGVGFQCLLGCSTLKWFDFKLSRETVTYFFLVVSESRDIPDSVDI